MASKTRKSNSWFECDKCHARVVSKDFDNHEKNCPPAPDVYIHPFVFAGTLSGPLEVKTNEEIKGLDFHEKNNLVFLSQSAIQLCNLVIGEWAIVKSINCAVPTLAKIVWPSTEKSLSSVLVTQTAHDLYWKGKNDIKVSVLKLNPAECKIAKQVVLVALNAPRSLHINNELNLRIKKLHLNRYIAEGNKLNCMFYGKNLEFLISEIIQCRSEVITEISDNPVKNLQDDFNNLSLSQEVFYKVTNNTDFKLFGDKKEVVVSKQINPLLEIGGYETEISDIQDLVDVATGKIPGVVGMKHSRGVLLYGHSGCGKTMMVKAIAEMSGSKVFSLNGTDLYSHFSGEVEAAINNLFNDAFQQAPSIILLDEIDILCPVRSSRISDLEKRCVASILNRMDEIHSSETCNVFMIATSSKPDGIDPAFRRSGRLDREIEIPIPNPNTRYVILKKILSRMANNVSEVEVKNITDLAHGFVGSDLNSLCSRGAMQAVKRLAAPQVEITFDDLKFALGKIRPSAMREIQIEIPNVKWTDIGGQSHLKLILKQAVEWPLQYPESFTRLGITPPRGVLMYGPPGCSKTMIAKALATESGLNFLSIKGPELFSKWVGESERAVREVFRKARQVAPSIIFFDEIDALGGERTSGASGGGTSVQERVLAQLLTELDGVTPLGEVTVLAATNRPDLIDKALLRPGRLDRIVYVPLPDAETRREIINLKLAKMPVQNTKVDILVDLTENYSGAEIHAVCHEAAMKALEGDLNAQIVNWEHFELALRIITPRTPQSLLDIYSQYSRRTLH